MRNERTASEKEWPQPRRKIEQQMIQALRKGQNWRGGNTAIMHQSNPSVYLHGNRIAFTCPDFDGLRCDTWTFRNWPTRTTVSRLRALGIDAAIRKGKPTIDGKEI